MNIFLRKTIGWGVATAYVLSGHRRRRLSAYKKQEGAILSLFGHNPKPHVLDSILNWLKHKGFHFISTDELLAMRDGEIKWTPQTAWLTFDDGWGGFEEYLLPILERYQVPATIFVAPGETERGKIWTNSIFGLMDDWKSLYEKSSDERYDAIDRVLAHAAVKMRRQLADKDELCRLAKHPLVTLENHTYTHLSCIHRPVEELLNEVKKTQCVLAEWTGRVPRLVCYPFGHCTDETDGAIRDIGLIPVTSFPGRMTLDTIGECRNMFHDAMGLWENVGRVLQAWPHVKVRMAKLCK